MLHDTPPGKLVLDEEPTTKTEAAETEKGSRSKLIYVGIALVLGFLVWKNASLSDEGPFAQLGEWGGFVMTGVAETIANYWPYALILLLLTYMTGRIPDAKFREMGLTIAQSDLFALFVVVLFAHYVVVVEQPSPLVPSLGVRIAALVGLIVGVRVLAARAEVVAQ
jgi:hypothetical protein